MDAKNCSRVADETSFQQNVLADKLSTVISTAIILTMIIVTTVILTKENGRLMVTISNLNPDKSDLVIKGETTKNRNLNKVGLH